MDKKNEKVIAKYLSGKDAEYMYETCEETPGTCPVCNNRLEDVINMSYKIRKKRWDMYDTYDCFCIVTETFKRFCEENDYPDLTFIQITTSPGFYYFMPEGIFKVDDVRSKVKFMNKRECCGSYDEIICSRPFYKSPDFILQTDDFILRTNHRFGSFQMKTQLVIIGLKTMRKMQDYGIKGIYFHNVYE